MVHLSRLHRRLDLLVLVGVLLGVVGCTSGVVAPIEHRGASGPQRVLVAREVVPQSDCPVGQYTVARGDTLYSIARKCNIPLRTLIEANGLKAPYALQIDQSLVLPRVQVHTVLAGDTLYSIARGYGVDVSALVRQNRLEAPYVIVPGQQLVLPGPGTLPADAATEPQQVKTAQTQARRREVQAPQSSQQPQQSRQPQQGRAGRNQETPHDIPDVRPIRRPADLRPVQPVQSASRAVPQTGRLADAIPRDIYPIKRPKTVSKPRQTASRVTASRVTAVQPPKSDGRRVQFAWPLRGKVISRYGAKSGGQQNDGINIAAAENAAVRASESGVVQYASDGFKGWGKLLLLHHKDGYITAYAHNSKLLVRRGDTVEKGQIIARVGQTGNVDRPQLHFEVRKGQRALDPQKVL